MFSQTLHWNKKNWIILASSDQSWWTHGSRTRWRTRRPTRWPCSMTMTTRPWPGRDYILNFSWQRKKIWLEARLDSNLERFIHSMLFRREAIIGWSWFLNLELKNGFILTLSSSSIWAKKALSCFYWELGRDTNPEQAFEEPSALHTATKTYHTEIGGFLLHQFQFLL